MEQSIDRVLDTKGLNCPLPVLKLKKAMKQVPPGGILQVLATDPGAVADFEAFCRQTGNQLLDAKTEGDVFVFLIRNT
jgi:tRNA 2-thiouridine synthesizing protein A